jgi:hypothetical protein
MNDTGVGIYCQYGFKKKNAPVFSKPSAFPVRTNSEFAVVCGGIDMEADIRTPAIN